MSSPGPTRTQGDLAEMLETLLDKGVVVNADIAVTVGDTELLGIEIRAALASFETAAKYGMAFPAGTDMDRVHEAAGLDAVESTADGSEQARRERTPDAMPTAQERSETVDDDPDDADAAVPTGEERAEPASTDASNEDGGT